jgi:hypothetical protein
MNGQELISSLLTINHQFSLVEQETISQNLRKLPQHNSWSLSRLHQQVQAHRFIATTGTNPGGAAANSYSSTAANDGAQMYAQVRINTTDYFLDPDNKPNDGIPGASSPYPRLLTMQPSFNLYPDVYVLPGQVWDVLVTQRGLSTAVTDMTLQAFVKYTLYDGPDALIANKLLELGISVSPANVDWYKRSLIQQQSSVVA